MKKYINKIISIFLLISLVISNLPLGAILAYARPSISVSSPSRSSINPGESVSYTVLYSDADTINLSSSYVTLNGFTANISISGSGDRRVVTLSNIKGTAGKKSISIRANSAENDSGYALATPNSVAFTLNNTTSNNSADKIRPSISVSSPSKASVSVGGNLSYTLSFADNVSISRVNTTASYITLNGFTANISITGAGMNRLVTLSNIQGKAGRKTISIKAGAALDKAGNSSLAQSSSSFEIVAKQTTPSNTKPSVNKNTTTNKNTTVNKKNNSNNTNLSINANSNISKVTASTVIKSTPKLVSGCDDSINVLGDINKEVKTFSTRITSQKSITTYAQENNYVAKDEEITYIVDYYNGKESTAKDVAIELNIPYNVDVLEINSDGKITEQTASKTTVEWNKGNVNSGSKCRLYVKVKFLQNTLLENSDKISEEFYVNLKTRYNDKNENEYLRQLFIDKNTSKTATINKYLTAIDNTNSIRPDDKITRAELAKILVDTGIIEVEKGNNDYKKYKDADEIPTYARNAVSALYSTGIIEEFSDGEFKPNNPIVRDEFFKIVSKAADYISEGKLKVKTATFIYTDIIDDKDKTMTDKKDYIMELIRQNVIEKEDVRADEYTLRREAVEIINALTFRGPYVENINVNVLKFADINEDNSYFYDIVGASNTYTYSYTDTLWQQIKNVK